VGDNETYLVQAGKMPYVLRVYYPRFWIKDKEDYLFELEWLAFLRSRGVSVSVSVSYALARRDGALLNAVQAPEGIRYWALFTFAEGGFFWPLDSQQSHRLGQEVAQIHLVSNDFISSRPRFHYDADFLLSQPAQRIARQFGDQFPEDIALIMAVAQETKERLLRLDLEGDGWGVIGGDFHGGNNHISDDGKFTFFDFDICGYGWRAYDLAVLCRNNALNGAPKEMGESYLEGYHTVRPLCGDERRALPLFMICRTIYRMGARIAEIEFKGDEPLGQDYWGMMVGALDRWQKEYL
jgi:Ser/Thr protein kinase RdoA (MazF antagonist)